MVEEVKRIKIKLRIVLEVVHVPDDMTIITKGMDSAKMCIVIFARVPFTPDMSQRTINKIGLPNTIPCHYRSWQTQDIFDCLTICSPPPEVMPQLINDVLLCSVGWHLMMAMIVVLLWVL
jgi:hypothetical protein